jgi:hypothetical protein
MGFGFVVFSFGFMCGRDDKTGKTESFLMNADKITVTLDLAYDVPLQPAAGYELKAIYYDLDMNEKGNEALYVGVNESFEAIIAKIPGGEYNVKFIVLNKSLKLLYESDIVWVTINEPTTLNFLMELRNQEEEQPAL